MQELRVTRLRARRPARRRSPRAEAAALAGQTCPSEEQRRGARALGSESRGPARERLRNALPGRDSGTALAMARGTMSLHDDSKSSWTALDDLGLGELERRARNRDGRAVVPLREWVALAEAWRIARPCARPAAIAPPRPAARHRPPDPVLEDGEARSRAHLERAVKPTRLRRAPPKASPAGSVLAAARARRSRRCRQHGGRRSGRRSRRSALFLVHPSARIQAGGTGSRHAGARTRRRAPPRP